jgi:hypothetical protein
MICPESFDPSEKISPNLRPRKLECRRGRNFAALGFSAGPPALAKLLCPLSTAGATNFPCPPGGGPPLGLLPDQKCVHRAGDEASDDG